MNASEKRKLESVPHIMRKRLEKKNRTPLEDKKERCILSYSSPVKLKAVIRWKERMARHGITTARIADYLDLPPPRISEWLNFTYEPTEDNFQRVEDALYKMGA